MTVIEPGGAPDWQGRGAVVSATLLDLENQAWANGTDNVFTYDMGPWNTVIVTGFTGEVGAGFTIEVDFYADPGLTELIASAGAVNWSQSKSMLILPVAARYMQIHAQISTVNPAGSTYQVRAWATSATRIPTGEFLLFPLFEEPAVAIAAGATQTFLPTLWIPTKYLLTVVTNATAWQAQIAALNNSGGNEGYMIKLSNTLGQQGIPYTFVAHRRQPQLEVTNNDAVARNFWIIASPDT